MRSWRRRMADMAKLYILSRVVCRRRNLTMRRPILTVLALLTLSAAAWAEPPKAAAPPALLDLRVSPLMDLHYWVRKLGSEKGELPAVEGLPAAVAAARQVGDSLGGQWGILDASFTGAATAEE